MIGRLEESKELARRYESGEAELVAVYGRRRVGKTYLINEVLKDRITFHHAGLSPAETNKDGLLKTQLAHFYLSLQLCGMKKSHRPKDWLEAFFMLETLLADKDDGGRQVVFIDELPWLDTPRSGFLTAFEAFWNTWGCGRKNLMVIICGSASSWILDHLINSYGGLYNRVTCEIRLHPFTLRECEEFYTARNVLLSRYDIVQSYMFLGGIPYYLGYIQGDLSLPQNIDALFFPQNAKLRQEYDRLFASIFANPEQMQRLVAFLSTRSTGYTRGEIADGLSLSDGGNLTKNLDALRNSDFVLKYVPYGLDRRQEHYKLIDPFCIFYLAFVEKNLQLSEGFWRSHSSSQQVISWRGFAFENVCFCHIRQIKEALGISGVHAALSSWSSRGDADSEGAQIDLLIDRDDNIINLCEIKYYGEKVTVSKTYYEQLLKRQRLIEASSPPRKTVRNTLITTFGAEKNAYSGIFSNIVTLDDLFRT